MRDEFDQRDLVKFGYRDGGRKGLLAGETLYLDLRLLEMADLEHNRREYEMARHVSLARLNPTALLKLKATGACEVSIPEWVFDLASPGQYMRRIKTVGLSIPCVSGPYTGVHCRMSLLRSSIRTLPIAGDADARSDSRTDGRFRDFSGAIQSIVTSSGQNDSGLFELSLRDDRYLPFEGRARSAAGGSSCPAKCGSSISTAFPDVVLHVRYTAREAGQLATAAVAPLPSS